MSTTINAGKYGYIIGTVDSTWTTARTSGANAHNQPTTNAYPTQVRRSSGRGGTDYWIRRFFASFDVSAYASHTITNLTFNFRSDDSGNTNIDGIVVKSTAQGNADTDLSASDFWTDVDMSTAYSSDFSWPDLDANVSATLNASAISQFSNSYLRICVVQYENDYGNSPPGADQNSYAFMNWDTGNSGYVPYIEFDSAAPGYGNKVIGVTSASIGEVIDVASGNIGEVIGV